VFEADFLKSPFCEISFCQPVSITEFGIMTQNRFPLDKIQGEVARLHFSNGDYYVFTKFLKANGRIEYRGYETVTMRIMRIWKGFVGFLSFVFVLVLGLIILAIICFILSIFGGGGTWSGGGSTSSGGSWSGGGTFK